MTKFTPSLHKAYYNFCRSSQPQINVNLSRQLWVICGLAPVYPYWISISRIFTDLASSACNELLGHTDMEIASLPSLTNCFGFGDIQVVNSFCRSFFRLWNQKDLNPAEGKQLTLRVQVLILLEFSLVYLNSPKC